MTVLTGATGFVGSNLLDKVLANSYEVAVTVRLISNLAWIESWLLNLVQHPQPSYLRLGKAGERAIHHSVPKIEPGIWCPVWKKKKPSEHRRLTTGFALQIANDWQGEAELHSFNLLTLQLWRMAFKYLQPKQVAEVRHLNTIEDHLLDGGFSSWMLESLISNSDQIINVHSQGLDSLVVGLVVTQSELHQIGGLKASNRSR